MTALLALSIPVTLVVLVSAAPRSLGAACIFVLIYAATAIGASLYWVATYNMTLAQAQLRAQL